MARTLPRGWRSLLFRLTDKVYGPGTRTTPWTWVADERIAIGNLPTPASLPRLANEEGITHVVNCRAKAQTTFSGDLYMERALFGRDRVACAEMWDHGRRQDPASWAAAAEFVAEALDDPQAKVLIHCQRGRRRSVLVAYAALRLRGHDPEQAARLILSHRREAHLVPAYRASVEDWLREREAAVRTPAPQVETRP